MQVVRLAYDFSGGMQALSWTGRGLHRERDESGDTQRQYPRLTSEGVYSKRRLTRAYARLAFRSRLFKFPLRARVVKWQTRTFEGRMPKGMGVQVPPRALFFLVTSRSVIRLRARAEGDPIGARLTSRGDLVFYGRTGAEESHHDQEPEQHQREQRWQPNVVPGKNRQYNHPPAGAEHDRAEEEPRS